MSISPAKIVKTQREDQAAADNNAWFVFPSFYPTRYIPPYPKKLAEEPKSYAEIRTRTSAMKQYSRKLFEMKAWARVDVLLDDGTGRQGECEVGAMESYRLQTSLYKSPKFRTFVVQ